MIRDQNESGYHESGFPFYLMHISLIIEIYLIEEQLFRVTKFVLSHNEQLEAINILKDTF